MFNKNFNSVPKEEPVEHFTGVEITYENEKQGENLFEVITKCKVGGNKSIYIMGEEKINQLIEQGHNQEPIQFNIWIPVSDINKIEGEYVILNDEKKLKYLNKDLLFEWKHFNMTKHERDYEIKENTFGLPLFYYFDYPTISTFDLCNYFFSKFGGIYKMNKNVRVSCQGLVNNTIDEIKYLIGEENLNQILVEGKKNERIHIYTYVPFEEIDDVSINHEWRGCNKFIRFKSGMGFYLNSKETYEDFHFLMNQNNTNLDKVWNNIYHEDDYDSFDEIIEFEKYQNNQITEDDEIIDLSVSDTLPF